MYAAAGVLCHCHFDARPVDVPGGETPEEERVCDDYPARTPKGLLLQFDGGALRAFLANPQAY